MIATNPNLILIVEDDRAQAALLAELLQTAGYTTECILHARDALERMQVSPTPALVITDVNLEEEDIGFAVASRCAIEGIPVIVITARDTDEKDRFMAIAGGAVAYIKKPYDPLTMRQQVANILSVRYGGSQNSVPLDDGYRCSADTQTIYHEDQVVSVLTDLQFKTFHKLAEAYPNNVLKSILSELLYGMNDVSTSSSVDALISRLRVRLALDKAPYKIITTSRGETMYRLEHRNNGQ